jgi:flagellar protein FlaI
MTNSDLPFVYEQSNDGCDHGPGCSLNSVLPKRLQEACAEHSYLSDYLHLVPMGEIGIPDFYPTLSRALRDLEERNLIYPVGQGLFVHVYPDATGARDYYIPVEPQLTVDLETIMPQVEDRLLKWAEEIGRAETSGERKETLSKALDSILTSNGAVGKIKVTPREMEAIKYVIMRDKVDLGLLQPFLLDPYIEDISCSGLGHIFIEHKIFRSLQSTLCFEKEEELDEFVIWLGEWVKRPVTVRNPIVDASLPDGSRINIVYGTDISRRGSNFTIRKFAGDPTSVMQLVEWGTLDYLMAAYLSFVLEEDLNVFVAGATASGKTTTLNAIMTFIRPDKKIISIEDTPELIVPHANWIQEVTRGTSRDNQDSAVGMFDLLKAALRQRPDRIIIGEIRGEEGAIAFQAMQTGHGVMSTFHAASVGKLIQRLTGDPINIPKAYVDNLDCVVIQAAVRQPGGGGMVRRVVSINEIVGYDPTSQSFSFIEAFRWNPANDTFEFLGYMNSYLMEEKIALKRGIPPYKKKSIYTELKRRAKIFERLHRERKVKSYSEVFRILAEAHRQHLL